MKKRGFLCFLLMLSLTLPTSYVQATEDENEYEKVTNTETFMTREYDAPMISSYGSLQNNTFGEAPFKEETREYETLVKKTTAKYEVAIAKSDMNFTYKDKADTYEEAVEKANELKGQYNELENTPAVIDSDGFVTYATSSIGRLLREFKDGTPYEVKNNADNVNAYLYGEPSLKNKCGYINDGYVSEMPLITENENEAKVLISGKEGWLNKNKNRDANHICKDVTIVAISQVKAPCYYYVKNGNLYHHINASIDHEWEEHNTTLLVGKAPSYMKEGVNYYSYDGDKYFYSGNSIADALEKLTKDLKSGTHSLAVNNGNPYMNYFKYLTFRTKTNYTAEELDRYINNNTEPNSKLRGLGKTFKSMEEKYGVNALITLGVAFNESGKGTSKFSLAINNLFGLDAIDSNPDHATKFESPEACVEEFTKKYISKWYSNPNNVAYYGGFLGSKEMGANVKYASDPYWADKAVNFIVDADNYLGNKDLNNYTLAQYTSSNTILSSSGKELYKVDNGNRVSLESGDSKSHVNYIIALNSKEAVNSNDAYYEINPDANVAIGETVTGEYNWNIKGFINANNIKILNLGKNIYSNEDINRDGKINITDLSMLANNYNSVKTNTSWKQSFDFNLDGIVDIYDITRLSSKL